MSDHIKATLQEEWICYRDRVYPRGLSRQQEVELHQAFFAAMLILFEKMTSISQTLSEEDASIALGRLQQEAFSTIATRIGNINARN